MRRLADLQTALLPACTHDSSLQAANSLVLSGSDRSCLNYLQDSVLVTILGKHWPWSTISYTYHRVAVKEPMVMSMILATTASEIHRSRLHDCSSTRVYLPANDSSDIDGRVHYGTALSRLREALTEGAKTPSKLEAIFITLWLMVDYENRFGSGASTINIHLRGVESLLHNHILPLLKLEECLAPAITAGSPETADLLFDNSAEGASLIERAASSPVDSVAGPSDRKLVYTAVPLFLLWTLYFFTPGVLFFGPGAVYEPGFEKVNDDLCRLFRLFLRAENGNTPLNLENLYRISRQSPSKFWGGAYPAKAQLDDMENYPGLALYHKSHVVQFRITELFRQARSTSWNEASYQQIVDEIVKIANEFEMLLSSAKAAPSCDIVGDGRRVMETIYWAAITYYSTIVYFHLCFGKLLPAKSMQAGLMSQEKAVSLVLELSLKLHRSRPHLMVRITWPLFMAGVATADRIYQDWVSIRLRELGRYGQNYSRVSRRFDEIICGSGLFASSQKQFPYYNAG
ncbi:C6 zinc finger domain protein [Aspergillus udagawae]|uniref:C6 zinc finger domain protein n=1 Tax=Aspergillus udagawae TaxID=91492 RepID=A0ABQ1ANJ1_9EURO|nr:C6 zinc finger domain protein [Aspergillus udagawae]GFF85179.1 C6 zinc finger domain protein [Aspergillus udagawae]GFG02699.1 C6 zinc finger domain protein [Aspergillus udagawae]GFG24192.1 C6 zinc finger domain protein [Aspergillus udagawae]